MLRCQRKAQVIRRWMLRKVLSTALASLAARAGVPPAEYAYDYLLENDGKSLLYRPLYNYFEKNLDVLREMLMDRDTVPGLSDGGAHYGFICDASFPTYLLTHWARDRSRGEKIPLELLVKMQTQDTAATVGLNDRGLLKPGYKADLNIIDFKNLHLHAPNEEKLRSFYETYGFRSLAAKAGGSVPPAPRAAAVMGDLFGGDPAADPAPVSRVQGPVSYTTITDWATFEQWLARIQAAELTALDTETKIGRAHV